MQQTHSIKKAVIYCRVSTKEQVEEGNSLTTQEKLCREFATKQGFVVDTVFLEQGESAKSTLRTQLQRLLTYISVKRHGISAVIVYKLDRLSRNTDDYSQLRLLMKRYGVEIKSTSEYFENTPAGRFMENIIANVAQFDNDVRTERSIGGMREAVREGRYVWMAPFGYDNVKVAGKATIAPNAQAPMVRKLFALVALNRYPVEEIRRKIGAQMIYKNGKSISRTRFYCLLKNELYTGWISKFGERNKGAFEPVVSEQIFNQVQRVLKGKGHRVLSYQLEHPDFPLRRFVQHPTLDYKLTGSWSKGRKKLYPYYRYSGPGFGWKKEELETTFGTFMNQYAMKEHTYNALSEYLKEELDTKTREKRKELEVLQKQIAILQEKQSALIQKNLQGVLSDMVLKKELEKIEVEITRIQILLPQEQTALPNYVDLLHFSAEYLKNPFSVWLKASFQARLKLQWFQFAKGITFDGENFGTAEVSLLFKTKQPFGADVSRVVNYPNSISGKEPLPAKKPAKKVDNVKLSDGTEMDRVVFNLTLAKELEHLAEILNQGK